MALKYPRPNKSMLLKRMKIKSDFSYSQLHNNGFIYIVLMVNQDNKVFINLGNATLHRGYYFSEFALSVAPLGHFLSKNSTTFQIKPTSVVMVRGGH